MSREFTFAYLDDFEGRRGVWRGTEPDAICAAEAYLGAWPEDDGSWRYVAEETGMTYEITRDDVVEAGAAILAGADDWYSLWCASCGTEVTCGAGSASRR